MTNFTFELYNITTTTVHESGIKIDDIIESTCIVLNKLQNEVNNSSKSFLVEKPTSKINIQSLNLNILL